MLDYSQNYGLIKNAFLKKFKIMLELSRAHFEHRILNLQAMIALIYFVKIQKNFFKQSIGCRTISMLMRFTCEFLRSALRTNRKIILAP